MAWTTPKTNWATGELVAASDLNAVGENLAMLDTLRSTVAVHTTSEDIQLVWHENFTDIDSDNLNLTLITAGGNVMVHFHGRVSHPRSRYDLEVDGNRIGNANNGIWHSDGGQFVSFTHLIQNLSAGSHTFKLQHSKHGCTLYAGAQFWVREI